MNYSGPKSLFAGRYALAIGAGLLWTAAFPKIGLAGFAWLAPGLLVAAGLGKRGWECFRIGFVGALAHYLTMLYWLLLIPYRWHGIPLGPAAGWLALSAALAVFPAAWLWLVVPPLRRRPRPGQEAPPLALAASWPARAAWAFAGAGAWVAQEMLIARILGGFPWDLLGVSQHQLVPLIQMASVTGVYGVSFMVVWVSLGLLAAGVMLIRRPGARSVWLAEIFLPILVVAVLFNLGFHQLRREPPPAQHLRMTLVQPSIPQTVIWSAQEDEARFQDLLRLTERALSNRTDVVVWPESAVPKMLRYDTNTFQSITGLARHHHVWMILGSDDAEPSRHPATLDQVDYFNSSFLIGPDGEILDRYVKRNLVIFGEYVPFSTWLPFLKYFTPIEGGFTPGTHAEQFELEPLGVSTSVLICFEDTFPQLARSDVKPRTDFLVNITNDGWFDDGAAQWQHAMTALFRAVENHVPLIRCCNNGLTCWIDARGRLREVFHDAHGDIYGEGYMQVEIPLPPANQTRQLTFYTRHGDWFGWGCVGLAGLWLAFRLAHYLATRWPATSIESQ